MSFRKLRVHRLKVWRREFLQNRALSTVLMTAQPKVTGPLGAHYYRIADESAP